MLGIMSPLGIIYVPKYQDQKYQQIPESEWSQYRLDNKYKLNRPDFDSLTEELYEIKKDSWIHKEQNRDYGFHHEERFKLGVWLRKQPDFMNAPNKKQQHIIARQIFRDLTESEVAELVEIARMDINLEEIDSMRENFNKGASGEAVSQTSAQGGTEKEDVCEEEDGDDTGLQQKVDDEEADWQRQREKESDKESKEEEDSSGKDLPPEDDSFVEFVDLDDKKPQT